jgi:predicted ester cyclase
LRRVELRTGAATTRAKPAFRAGFPDLRVSIEDLLTDGDRFASRATVTGTHTGDLMGMPATGSKPVTR